MTPSFPTRRSSDLRFTLLSSRNAARPSSHEWSIHPVKKHIMKINRREERKTQRRASILEVARRSFFEKGYAATTMSGIAATLGGSQSTRSEEHTSELQSLMRISYAVFCLKK